MLLAIPINTPLSANSVFKNHSNREQKVKQWVRKTCSSYLNPFKLSAFYPLSGGSALVLLMEIFKWIVKRLVGVLFLGGVTCGGDFGQLG